MWSIRPILPITMAGVVSNAQCSTRSLAAKWKSATDMARISDLVRSMHQVRAGNGPGRRSRNDLTSPDRALPHFRDISSL